jgi:hypothetical protein
MPESMNHRPSIYVADIVFCGGIGGDVHVPNHLCKWTFTDGSKGVAVLTRGWLIGGAVELSNS